MITVEVVNVIAQVVLTPWESRRLIAKAVASLDIVKKAMKNGIVAIARGSTSGMVVEELLKGKFSRGNYIAGCVRPQRLCISLNKDTLPEIAFFHGKVKEIPAGEVVKEMGAGDVFIKGANAVDPDLNAGIFLGTPIGGTSGATIGSIYAKGIHFVIPVGLEKLIPVKVNEASLAAGYTKVDYSTGMPVGLFPIRGQVITEIQAIKSFCDVEVVPIGAGGMDGAEGSIVLNVSGADSEVENILEIIRKLLGEKPLEIPERRCADCDWGTCRWAGKEKFY